MTKKQLHIVGTEPKKIPAIEKAGEAWKEARDARMKMTIEETETKAACLKVIEEHAKELEKDEDGNLTYLLAEMDPPQIITLIHLDKTKIIIRSADDPAE